jgi:hypothetical protein
MKPLYLFWIIFFFSVSANSQTILLQEDVSKLDILKPKYGQNMANFDHWYLDFGFAAEQSAGKGADIRYGFSHSFSVGNRYKRKIANFLAVGTDISYLYMVYDIRQNSEKMIPDNINHKNEKFRLNTLYGDVFLRFNFGRRGNIIGKFLDIGPYGDWSFSTKHLTVDKVDLGNLPNGFKELKTVHRGLSYFNDYNYGAVCRIGFNRYCVFAMYRMSDFFTKEFKTSVADVELPRLTVGVQIGLHK